MKQQLFNIKIDIHNYDEAIKFTAEALSGNRCKLVYFINAHCFNIAQKNEEYKNALNTVDLLLNDGVGIEIASKLANIKLKENMNGTDFIPKVMDFACLNKYKVYLLGGKDNVPNIAKKKLEETYKDIKIVGVHNGYFNKEEEQNIIDDINNSNADILVVGMGVPKQELWLYNNKNEFTNLKLGIAGGAILDFISGNVKRAPKYIRRLKLEWLYRLYREPRRLWKRYVVGNAKFLIYVISFKLGMKR